MGDEQLAATQSHGVLSQRRYVELTGNNVVAALAGTENFIHVEKDDFVISLRTFEGGIERASESGCISPAYTAMKPSQAVDPNFFQHLLKSEAFISRLQTTVTGIREGKSVRFENFADIVLPVPDLPTQKRIAAFLERETGRIDELIARKDRLVDVLREGLLSELERLVTPENPSHEEMIPFRWVCRIAEGQVDPTAPEWSAKPLIAPNHIESRTGRLIAIETAVEQGAISGKYAFPSGTVLYSKIRPNLAKACISTVEGMCSADMYPVLPDRRLQPQFLLMQLLSEKFTAWATLESMRVAMPKINRETLSSYRLWVPEISVQEKAAHKFFAAQGRNEALSAKVIASID